MSGDDSSLNLRAPAWETVFRPFPLASPSGALYIERMFFLRRCINQSVHYLRLYRSLYSNTLALSQSMDRKRRRVAALGVRWRVDDARPRVGMIRQPREVNGGSSGRRCFLGPMGKVPAVVVAVGCLMLSASKRSGPELARC